MTKPPPSAFQPTTHIPAHRDDPCFPLLADDGGNPLKRLELWDAILPRLAGPQDSHAAATASTATRFTVAELTCGCG